MFWVMSAEAVIDFLQPRLEHWCELEYLPQAWSIGHLTFLSKLGRA